MAVVLLLVLALVVAAGRYSSARTAVQSAANAAARDASLARNSQAARLAGQDAAKRVLSQKSLECTSSTVSVGTGGFAAPLTQQGSVQVQVSCTIANDKVSLPFLPGTATFHAEASSPIDRYRER